MTAKESAKMEIEKQKAHTLVFDEMRAGRLIKPDRCEKCGKRTTDLEAHHGNYSKPLSVQWLCTKCHGALHADLRAKAWRAVGGKYRRSNIRAKASK
jgi:hypothetical protein